MLWVWVKRGDGREWEEGGEEWAEEVGGVEEESRWWGNDDRCASLMVGQASAISFPLWYRSVSVRR